nr:DUF2273 domain-containing protein [Paenibacillus shirakamiensis]
MWRQIWESYKGRLLGLATALLLIPIYLMFGFWNMLFCALLLFVGYSIGKHKDLSQEPLVPWNTLREWLNARWRPFK